MSAKSRCRSHEQRVQSVQIERAMQAQDLEKSNRPWERLRSHHTWLTKAELRTLDRELAFNKGSFALTVGHALTFEAKRAQREASAGVLTLAAALRAKFFGAGGRRASHVGS